MRTLRRDITIPVQPWFQDHRFGGQAVLPAVETMQLLATQAASHYPGVFLHCLEEVTFAKFLVLSQGAAVVNALVELSEPAHGRVCVKLLSRVKMKRMSRIIEHGSVSFCLGPYDGPALEMQELSDDERWDKEIDAKKIYTDLVPFGPGYQTLHDTLYLARSWARGQLKSPDFPLSTEGNDSLGSPFPLDGSLHGACVLGQQSVDFIPFPVGFARRIIHQPTRPGRRYSTCIRQLVSRQDELVFDLGIFDSDQRVCESVYGVRMRDVSRGISRN